jgi:hypothetical protein
MVMLNKKSLVFTLVITSIFSILVGSWAATNASGQVTGNQTMANQTTTSSAMNNNQTTTAAKTTHNVTIVRDSEAVLLDGKSIPGNDYIHLYDTTPFAIVNGHVAAKVPCDSNSTSQVQILIGSAPDFHPADLENVAALSTPGELCLYHVDLASNATSMITDIAIKNPSNSTIDFPDTSTVVIGVNEIMQGGEEHDISEGHRTAGNNMTMTG